jgi:putative membrane-bound dehydrogenase-like protein
MLRALRHAWTLTLIGLSIPPADLAGEERWLHRFERTTLSSDFLSEGATFGDVSNDGVNDLIAGPYWYQGPDFKERREYYPPKTFDPKVYSDNFFAYLEDFNADGWKDILIIGFPGQDASWYENPRGAAGHWKRHQVFDVVDNESPTFADLTGDGKREIVCHTGGVFGFASPDWKRPQEKWRFQPIAEKRNIQRFTHGMGIGDVSGDGKLDVLEKDGWYEQPASLEGAPLWKYHAFQFTPFGGAQMYAYDVDGDGDHDVITSLRAHGKGLAWFEHLRKDGGGAIDFTPHLILETPDKPWADLEKPFHDVDFGQLHAIDLIDVDGDGLKDLVTGKRFQAHFGEPGAADPALIYWFRLTRPAPGKVEYVPYLIDDASGIGTQVVAGDIDGDGLPDVVVGNKKGTFFLRHQKVKVSEEEWKKAQPRRRAVFHRGGLGPKDAVAAMTVPDGFRVELIAAEPDLHQPVALALDERGRLWVAEGHTYPRRAGGAGGKWNEGKDRIVIVADEDGDGRFETRKVFAENLNLVSGLEVGFGGVWVGAAPYLLFLPDRNRDDRPDGEPEVLLDGWGFHDTHETLNSFIWGPDGWLYGCHGVFTHSKVGKPGAPDSERTPLNAGYWRYHPTRRAFEVFAWGTSNPWGIDFNDRGQAFATACVIPHLYHVIQGGRYQRQAGQHFDVYAYDDLKTIADHRHYAGEIGEHAWWGHEPTTPKSTLDAGGGHAHCGAMVYLGGSFPSEFRDRLLMNNIHGNRVNTDILEPRGSGYAGRHGSDLLISNDAWFRGISLRYGPDGAVYLIDWYDQNACHRVDPLIWDRGNGRLYRVAYGESKAARVDLAALGDLELVELQLHPNDWYVRAARRVLQERGGSPAVHAALAALVRKTPDETRKLRALWALHAAGGLDESLALELLHYPEEHVRAWTVQLACENGRPSVRLLDKLATLSHHDPSAVVRLYLASALQRLALESRLAIARGLLSRAEDAADHNLPLMVWYGIEPLAAARPALAMDLARESRVPLLSRYLVRRASADVGRLDAVMAALRAEKDEEMLELILAQMLSAFEGHAEIPMPSGWTPVFEKLSRSSREPVRDLARAAAVRFGDRRVFPLLRETLADAQAPLEKRRHALKVLLDGRDPDIAPVLLRVLDDAELRLPALRALAVHDHPDAAAALLSRYASMKSDERVAAVEALTSRPGSALALFDAIRHGKFPGKDLGAYSIRKLRSLGDGRIDGQIAEVWGQAREADADKVAVIGEWKGLLTPERLKSADLPNGRAVFARVCATCHSLFGAGAAISPDLTGSDRANLDYVLENVVDPNAVVGKDYQMHLITTQGGGVINGLILKETDSAVTLRTITDEVVVARKEITSKTLSPNSLMPEGLLDNLEKREVCDLIAYLASPAQVFLPGAPAKVDPSTRRVAGAIEGEALKLIERSAGSAAPQDMVPFGRDVWSGNSQLWWTGARPGARLALALPIARTGAYAIDVALTKARDYGIVQLWLDDQKAEGPIDCYNHPDVIHTGTLRLGEFRLEAGEHRLGVEILGAHPTAVQAFMFGLDFVLLTELK